MKLNHKKAEEVIDRIDQFHRDGLGEPHGFDMSLWYAEHGVRTNVPESQRYAPECRTSACLAGWTVTLLDSAERCRTLMGTKTDIHGGIGELFMDEASKLLEADDEAEVLLCDLFCRLSYTWDEVKAELLYIIEQTDDVSIDSW